MNTMAELLNVSIDLLGQKIKETDATLDACDEEKTDINMSRNKGHQGNFLLLYTQRKI